MADDFQDKLNSILSNPEMMRAISSLANSFGDSGAKEEDDSISMPQPDIASNLQSVMSSRDMSSDSRINLLSALKPYMRSSRVAQMDNAIRILKLTKLTSVLKDI